MNLPEYHSCRLTDNYNIMLIDKFSRNINYLRMSVTDRCNLRCKYCMPENGVPDKLPHEEILRNEEFLQIADAAAAAGITKIRLTGGEPLVRKGLIELVAGIASMNFQDFAMTTNGILLAKNAEVLKASGLHRVNISLDTLQEDRFNDLTGFYGLDNVLEGIDAAKKAGLNPVKINMVVIKGFNDDEIMDFIEFAMFENVEVRFIELMSIGGTSEWAKGRTIPNSDIIRNIDGLVSEPDENSVSQKYFLKESGAAIGFISPHEKDFCLRCNKLRLSSTGKLFPCLHNSTFIDIKTPLRTGDDISKIFYQAVQQKPEKNFYEASTAAVINMNSIGG